jgi:D-alanyl-D-alanine carboxypeptidase
MLPGATFGHPYILGGRTGFTTPAGHCFVGMAYHNGLRLVSVVMYSREPDRWQDTRVLLDYGFINFDFREIATENELLKTVTIENPRLGDEDTLNLLLYSGHVALLSRAEYAAIRREIVFEPLFEAEHDGENIILRAPIEDGENVAAVLYKIGGEVIFSSVAVAARQVYERTFDSDMDYYMALVLNNMFTTRALPYWFGIFGTVFGIVGISAAIVTSRRARKIRRWQTPGPRPRGNRR